MFKLFVITRYTNIVGASVATNVLEFNTSQERAIATSAMLEATKASDTLNITTINLN